MFRTMSSFNEGLYHEVSFVASSPCERPKPSFLIIVPVFHLASAGDRALSKEELVIEKFSCIGYNCFPLDERVEVVTTRILGQVLVY